MLCDVEWSAGAAVADWVRASAKTCQTLTTHAIVDIMRFVVALAVYLRLRCDALVIMDDPMADPSWSPTSRTVGQRL